jgi:TonB family protein
VKQHGITWRRLIFAVGLSVLISGAFWIPALAQFAALTERHEELEVAYFPDIADDSTKADEQPIPPPDEEKPKDKIKEAKKEQEKKPPPEPASVPEPKAKEAELELKPPPKPAPPPPPQPIIDHRMQMVTQEKFPDEADNKDAHFLAEKNHRAAQDTRAKNTNLIREVQSPQTEQSEKSANQQPDPGMKDQKLAELQDRKGVKNELVRSQQVAGQEGQADNHEPKPPGPLSMRDLTPKAAIDPQEEVKEREGLDKQEREKNGELPMARVGQAGERAVAASKGAHVNLRLNNNAYDRIEGFAAAENERRQAALGQKSHVAGHWDKMQQKMAAVRSSIENFTPAVRVGNQEELGTRASPFAAYVTAMHRQIHKLFTLGFLSDIDLRQDSQYKDDTLWTQLEIVVKGDGSVERVGIVRTSGVLAFDVAAIDSVMSAAPFPAPPQSIKSVNGKVYLDWQFHRDERACGTFGVDPHILTSVNEPVPHDTSETGAQAKAMQRAAEANGGANGGAGAQNLGGNAPSSTEGGPRRLAREKPHQSGDDDIPSARPPSETVVQTEVTSEAHAAAEGWFAAFTRGDAAWLAGWSATPFTAAGEVIARDAPTLKKMYRDLLSETNGSRSVTGLKLMTAAGVRGELGGLPPGGEPSEMLYAIGKVGRDDFILLLKKSNQGWRVCGLDR